MGLVLVKRYMQAVWMWCDAGLGTWHDHPLWWGACLSPGCCNMDLCILDGCNNPQDVNAVGGRLTEPAPRMLWGVDGSTLTLRKTPHYLIGSRSRFLWANFGWLFLPREVEMTPLRLHTHLYRHLSLYFFNENIFLSEYRKQMKTDVENRYSPSKHRRQQTNSNTN